MSACPQVRRLQRTSAFKAAAIVKHRHLIANVLLFFPPKWGAGLIAQTEGLKVQLFGILFCFGVGAATATGMILAFQKDRVFDSVRFLNHFIAQIKEANSRRVNLLKELKETKSQNQLLLRQLDELKKSETQMVNEIRTLEMAWTRETGKLRSTNRVIADEAIVFGRGREWVYAYTFPVQEQLAHERRNSHFPIKIGMSTQDDVVTRVHQQVSGNSTAISEKAVIRLIFRVNNSREMETWMHDYLSRNGRKVSGSVGTEWFNTNPLEVEQLFRSYILQRSCVAEPILS